MSKPLHHLLRQTPPATTLLRAFTTLSKNPSPPSFSSRLLTTITHPPRRRPFQLPHWPRRTYTTNPPKPNPAYNPTPHLQSPKPSLSLSARLRKLSREYGWAAFGVYLALTMLDFPFCFMTVRYIGADKIGKYEHVVVEFVGGYIPEGVKEGWRGVRGKVVEMWEGWRGEGGEEAEREGYAVVSRGDVADAGEGEVEFGQGLKEAEGMNQSDNASIWTQLALAYAIHKSFIFVRVPLTVAVTPKVVKVLRGWGWDIGKRAPKEVRAAKKAAKAQAKAAEKKPKGS